MDDKALKQSLEELKDYLGLPEGYEVDFSYLLNTDTKREGSKPPKKKAIRKKANRTK